MSKAFKEEMARQAARRKAKKAPAPVEAEPVVEVAPIAAIVEAADAVATPVVEAAKSGLGKLKSVLGLDKKS